MDAKEFKDLNNFIC